jgi:uncharacterized protein YndB with AHSA1/START domain
MTTNTSPSHSVKHDTITLERHYDATSANVFAAWSDPNIKRQWFGDIANWEEIVYRLDFRVGGTEFSRSRPKTGGQEHQYDARYEDIITNQRIVLAYTMTLDNTRISSSLLTIEFREMGGGTLLTLTEQLAILDGTDSVESRRSGWQWLLDALNTTLGNH